MVNIYLYAIWVKLIFLGRNLVRRKTNAEYIVIVKLDEIGDYILFRNFLEEVWNQFSTGNKKIVLIGNFLWKDLSLFLDNQYIAEFIAVDMRQKDSVEYLRKIIRQTSGAKVDMLINASFTRKPFSDIISFLVSAPRKFAFMGKTRGTGFLCRLRANVYNNKVFLPDHIVHEFSRNLYYFEHILQKKIGIVRPVIPKTIDLLPGSGFTIPGPYMVIFIGGTDSGRKWPVQNYIQLIISMEVPVMIVLVGGKSEVAAGNLITSCISGSGKVINLTGKTSLVEMFQVIKGATLVIGNESGVIHIADALNIRSICILGGGHFNRFVPYPSGSHSKIESVFRHMDCFNCDWICIYKKTPGSAYPCVDGVTVKQVQNAAESLLS